MLGTIAKGATEKPAEMTTLEFVGGAIFLELAIFFFPAGGERFFLSSLMDEQEIEMSLYIGGNCSATLFIAVNSLHRYSQEFGDFFLCFSQLLS